MSRLSPMLNILLTLLLPPIKLISRRFVLNSLGGIFLTIGVILGCVALYNFLLPQIGVVSSLMTLGGLSIATGLIFILVGIILKMRRRRQARMDSMLHLLKENLNVEGLQKMLASPSFKIVVGSLLVAWLTAQLTNKACKEEA